MGDCWRWHIPISAAHKKVLPCSPLLPSSHCPVTFVPSSVAALVAFMNISHWYEWIFLIRSRKGLVNPTLNLWKNLAIISVCSRNALRLSCGQFLPSISWAEEGLIVRGPSLHCHLRGAQSQSLQSSWYPSPFANLLGVLFSRHQLWSQPA